MSRKIKAIAIGKRCKHCKQAVKQGMSDWQISLDSSFYADTPKEIKESEISASIGYGDGYELSIMSINNDFDIGGDTSHDPCMFAIDIPIKYCPFCGNKLKAGRIPDEYKKIPAYAND